ncbi:MAG: LysR family transcriptional regulator [Terracidiphilus sp.]|nr:LysR family transcriptional regulator [Terracidiphilus sp.]
MSDPEWNHLQTFLTLARTHRLASAGRRLRADHSTVSRHISTLEESLSATLFERREEGFYLTPEGERLFAAAEQMESLMLDAHNDIAGKDLSLNGTVRIGAPDGLGAGFLAARLARLAAAHPGLAIELVAIPRVFNLTKREADIAISLTRPAKGRLIGRKILDYSLRLFASHAYLESHPAIRKPADLMQHVVIGYIEDLTAIPELNYLDQIHPSLKPAFSSSTAIVQMQAISAGAGVGVLPVFLARTNPELECVLEEQVCIRRTFWLSTHADLHRLTRVRLLCDFIAQQIQGEAEQFA